MLSLENLELGYQGNTILYDICARVNKGELIAIIGPNGAGKSTLLRALSRNLRPNRGSIRIYGKNIHQIRQKELAIKMAYLPQSFTFFGTISVYHFVAYGRFPHLGWHGRLTSQDHQIVNFILEQLDLQILKHRSLQSLSGGERQRVRLGMAMAQQSELLLLDEPGNFLDLNHQLHLMEIIESINQEKGVTVLMVLHDINQAARFAKRIWVLKDNRLFLDSTPECVVTSDIMKQVFQVEGEVIRNRENLVHFIPSRSLGI
jgi:iron complex transport system ATP-binding protein